MRKVLTVCLLTVLCLFLIIPALADAEQAASAAMEENEAVLTLRTQLIARNPDFTLDLIGSVSQEQANALLSAALAHTGNPKEGDYLKNHLIDCIPEISIADGKSQLHYQPAYKSTAAQEQAVDAAVADFFTTYPVKEIESEYERAYAIYDFICDTVVYDYARKHDTRLYYGEREIEGILIANTAYAALVEGTAVCEGYASLFYRLALEAGLDARIIYGFAYEAHTWNMVRIDGQYYLLDATWDAGSYWNYEYFLVPELYMHETDEAFITDYPLAETPYNRPEPKIFREGDYSYSRTYGASITMYNGNDVDVIVPETLGGLPVVSAKQMSFTSGDMQSLTFPEGFRRIKDAIYAGGLKEIRLPASASWSEDTLCPLHAGGLQRIVIDENNKYAQVIDGIVYSHNMRSVLYCPPQLEIETVTVPVGVEQVASGAFLDCTHIRSVILPDSIKAINSFAFDGATSLEEINIPSGCESIDQWAFGKTAIKELHIPASVTYIGGKIAGYCQDLAHITVEEGCENYYAEDDVLYHRVYDDKTEILRYPAGRYDTSFTVPEHVVYINDFSGSTHLEQVELPDGLVLIAGEAFCHCDSLKEITIPESVLDIWEMAFYNCGSLRKITVLSDTVGLAYFSFGDPQSRRGNLVIAGHAGSTVQQYARNCGLTFEEIP